MKIIFLILFIMVSMTNDILSQNYKNKIDSLKADKDVKVFLEQIYKKSELDDDEDNKKKVFYINPIKKLYKKGFAKYVVDSLNIKSCWQITDLNNDGYTDIIGIESSSDLKRADIFIVFYKGKEEYQFKYFLSAKDSYEDSFTIPTIEFKGQDKIIHLHQYQNRYDRTTPNVLKKTSLVIKEFGVVEYNDKNNIGYNIERIEFSTSPCYGPCPIFKINIDSNRLSELVVSSRFENDLQGTFTTYIDDKNYNKIIANLSYIDFPNLEGDYEVNATDQATFYLKIFYNNGLIKNIKDYGGQGTYGLSSLYSILFDLRKNQKWAKK